MKRAIGVHLEFPLASLITPLLIACKFSSEDGRQYFRSLISLSTDVLFSQKIVERANENNKPRDMTANARGWGWVNE